MEITYESPDSTMRTTTVHGQMTSGESYEFDLEKGERIVCVEIFAMECIDQVTFKTNSKKTKGPFGGIGGFGYTKDFSKCEGARLAFFKGRICTDFDDVTTLRELQLFWVREKPQEAACVKLEQSAVLDWHYFLAFAFFRHLHFKVPAQDQLQHLL